MPKYQLRIVAMLLVTCLLADPLTAHALVFTEISRVKATSSLLTNQALSAAPMTIHKGFGKLDSVLKMVTLTMLFLAAPHNVAADSAEESKPKPTVRHQTMIELLAEHKVFGSAETPTSEQPMESPAPARKPIDFSVHSPLAPKVRPMILPEQPRMPFQQQGAPKQWVFFSGRAPDAPNQPAHIPVERPIKSFKTYPYQNLIIPNAHRYGLDALLVRILLQKESKGDPNAESDAGAIGLMQIEPDTATEIAEELGLIHEGETIADVLKDPVRNIRIGTRYLCILSKRYNGALDLVLAAYNAGMGKVDIWIATTGRLGWIPFRETRDYVSSITEKYQAAGGDITRPVSTVLPNGDPINRTASLVLPLIIGAVAVFHHFFPTGTSADVQLAGFGTEWLSGGLFLFFISSMMFGSGPKSSLGWSDIWAHFRADWGPYRGLRADFWSTLFSSSARSGPMKCILDIGTGNFAVANIARRMLPQAEIYAIDPATLPAHRIPRGIEHRMWPAEKMELADNSVDLAVSMHGLEYSNLSQSLPELFRVLRPGARGEFIFHHPEDMDVKNAAIFRQQASVVDNLRVFSKAREQLIRTPENAFGSFVRDGVLSILQMSIENRIRQNQPIGYLQDVFEKLNDTVLYMYSRTSALREIESLIHHHELGLFSSEAVAAAAAKFSDEATIRSELTAAGFDVKIIELFKDKGGLVGWHVSVRKPINPKITEPLLGSA